LSSFWQEFSFGGHELVNSTNPHSGNYSSELCGYSNCLDSIGQRFTIPKHASTISITYWWSGQTTSTSSGCKDTFTVYVSVSSGNVIGQIQIACNSDATQNWHQMAFDATGMLSTYVGQTVRLVFKVITTADSTTSAFFVDDVDVSAA
jgi:hypothetical protein